MRKTQTVGISLLFVALVGGGGWLLLHGRDPIGNARQRMARGDMRGAELYLRQAVRAQPQNGEAAFLLGRVDLALGNAPAAELELRRAQDRHYDHAATILPLGQAYLQQRRFDAALRDFDPAAAPPAERGDMLVIRAAALLSQDDLAGAAAASAQAEALQPAKAETLLTASRIALARDDLDGAAARVAKLLAAAPKEQEALLLQGEIALRRNAPAAALASAQAVLAGSADSPDGHLIEARALLALGRADDARAALGQVLRGAPRNVSANYLNTILALQKNDYNTADVSLTRISAVLDKVPHGYYFLGVAKMGLGQPAQAEEAVTKFLAQFPDDRPALKLLVFVHLASHQPAAALALLAQGKLHDTPDADTLDLTGRAQAMSGDLGAARGSFTEGSRLAPGDAAIINRLAATQLTLGDSLAAEADLRRSLKIDPGQRLVGEAVIQAALARGDFADATRGVAQLRQATGDIETAGVLAAQVKMAALDLDGAEAELAAVLDRFPDSRAAALNLVRLHSLRGDQAKVEAELEKLLARHPDDRVALGLLVPLLFTNGQGDRAIKAAEVAHGMAPADTVVTATLAGAYVRAHQAGRATALLDRTSVQSDPQLDAMRARVLAADDKLDEAERAFTDILRLDPNNLRIRNELAGLQLSEKHYDAARATLREGLTLSPGNPGMMSAIVRTDLEQGGITQALAGVAALRRDPANLPAANTLVGDAWLSAGDRKQAAAAFLAAFHDTPTSELATRAATELAQNGNAEQAVALLSGWVADHPRDVAAQSVLASICISTHDFDKAAQHLDAVLAVRQTDTVTLNNLAWIKGQGGDLAQARVLAERAFYQTPSPEIADTLGWILARSGDFRTALPVLSQAIANPDPASRAAALYHYGFTLNAAGRTSEARAQLRSAVDGKVAFEERDDAGKLLASLK